MVFLLTRTHSVVRVSDAMPRRRECRSAGGARERKREKRKGKKRPEP
jgi:hypothetical protein